MGTKPIAKRGRKTKQSSGDGSTPKPQGNQKRGLEDARGPCRELRVTGDGTSGKHLTRKHISSLLKKARRAIKLCIFVRRKKKL